MEVAKETANRDGQLKKKKKARIKHTAVLLSMHNVLFKSLDDVLWMLSLVLIFQPIIIRTGCVRFSGLSGTGTTLKND